MPRPVPPAPAAAARSWQILSAPPRPPRLPEPVGVVLVTKNDIGCGGVRGAAGAWARTTVAAALKASAPTAMIKLFLMPVGSFPWPPRLAPAVRLSLP